MKLSLGLLIVVLITSCGGIDMKEFSYGDGSGNLYTLKVSGKAHLTYDPVTPMESSTGMYSGGDPWSVELADSQLAQLKELAQRALGKKEDLIPDRIKGSGAVTWTSANGSESVILKNGSTIKTELEDFLKKLKP